MNNTSILPTFFFYIYSSNISLNEIMYDWQSNNCSEVSARGDFQPQVVEWAGAEITLLRPKSTGIYEESQHRERKEAHSANKETRNLKQKRNIECGWKQVNLISLEK